MKSQISSDQDQVEGVSTRVSPERTTGTRPCIPLSYLNSPPTRFKFEDRTLYGPSTHWNFSSYLGRIGVEGIDTFSLSLRMEYYNGPPYLIYGIQSTGRFPVRQSYSIYV